jgi:hypothetical protein
LKTSIRRLYRIKHFRCRSDPLRQIGEKFSRRSSTGLRYHPARLGTGPSFLRALSYIHAVILIIVHLMTQLAAKRGLQKAQRDVDALMKGRQIGADSPFWRT